MKIFSETEWKRVSVRNVRLLQDFVRYHEEKGDMSPTTLWKYRSQLRLWFVFLVWSGKNIPHTKTNPYMWKRFDAWLKRQIDIYGTISTRQPAIDVLNQYICEARADEYRFFVRKIQKGANRSGKKDQAERPDEP